MSKKVIEPVIIEQRKHTSFELIENDNGDLGIRTIVALFTLEKEFRTTVAKAICPEYQKVIDQNAKLVEAVEEVKDMLESPKLIDGRVLRHIVNEALQNNKKIEG